MMFPSASVSIDEEGLWLSECASVYEKEKML